MNDTPYRGRFAPSPTGPLHFGSLVAAVASYVDARAAHGQWLVRMEDLDPPREQPGAAADILRTLERFGLGWDEEVLYQSRRHAAYEEALQQLLQSGRIYPCACSRSDIRRDSAGSGNPRVYPGTCRDGLPPGKSGRALRLRVGDALVGFDDRIQGRVEEFLPAAVGDFVLRRADGLYAYQLAVVVDDAAQRITEVVRGADLLDSTCRQIYLQQQLAYATPRYLHLPVAVNAAGEKLSKQTHAAPVGHAPVRETLLQALSFLGQSPPPPAEFANGAEVLDWAVKHWSSAGIPPQQALPQPGEAV
ncbi:MAG TPA: tRNA glutamyl-Q(34) synthetase GluQRS [Gammaproteobacteria bacterium]|nr:tRNA glutamyl-Q(34) synthetase GluQRS [Gammaproteobacteria bacterium]